MISKNFTCKCRELIDDDPTESIGKVYKKNRKGSLKDLTENQQEYVHIDIPSLEQCSSSLYKHRGIHYPPEPKVASDFDTKSKWLFFDESDESMVKGETKIGDEKRIIIFSSEDCLKLFAKAEGLSGDGTFFSTPKNFYQILIISGEVTPDYWVPLVYIWCPNKEGTTYDFAFGMLKALLDERGLELKALYFMCDFEQALRDAFLRVFFWLLLKGCHFHYGQSLWKFVVANGLKVQYSEMGNEDLAELIRLAMSLAFVRLDLFGEAYEILEEAAENLQDQFQEFGQRFLDYHRSTWVNGQYPPEQWNFFMFPG